MWLWHRAKLLKLTNLQILKLPDKNKKHVIRHMIFINSKIKLSSYSEKSFFLKKKPLDSRKKNLTKWGDVFNHRLSIWNSDSHSASIYSNA